MIPQGHQVGDVTHERKDADGISLFLIALLLLILLAICILAVLGVVHVLNAERRAQQTPSSSVVRRSKDFPEPQLQVLPGRAFKQDLVAQERELNSYGWVDRSKGVARIPIGKAMQLLVERGLPEVGAGQTRLQLMQARPQTDVQPVNPVTAPEAGPTP